MLTLFVFTVLTSLVAAERFAVSGRVYCPLDEPLDPYTIGRVQIYEHDSLPLDQHDFMGETELSQNEFHNIIFDESEVTGIQPLAVVLHDCHEQLRLERNRPRKSGCKAVTEHFFDAPQGNEIFLEIDLRNQLSSLHCQGNSNRIAFAFNDDVEGSGENGENWSHLERILNMTKEHFSELNNETHV
ncbi:unnamed protein product [Bursaphelenchus xylophilus]|uniref:(pine wood nematode) hypothetical protein n=1 Tax=Bursaphelenchus xylophilus TaxID=6326 RepID=A0A1I7RLT1_BURXY|nr:unnamed protein product [Bursaphelenchus xylophilus]CAG9106282.1 unnamed protein product [Bursaphelenchus xylophilus]